MILYEILGSTIMLKKVYKIILYSILAIFTVTSLAGCANRQPSKNNTANFTPTIFLHGWGSSSNAEEQMTTYIHNRGISDSKIIADVNPKGQVTLHGNIPNNAKNPLVEVNFENNRNKNYKEDGTWLKNVILALQKNYHIKKFNVVAHSMGNMALMYYLLANGSNKKLPQLQKQVDIAGHFDGILHMNQPSELTIDKNGCPNKMIGDYKKLLPLRNNFPKQIKVLNIMGNYKNRHNDEDVSNTSSMTLRYLVSKRAKSYQEKIITGKKAQHSQLHESFKVDHMLVKFLWNK